MNKILVLTDFSFSAFNAARYAVMLAGKFETSQIILYHSIARDPVIVGSSFPTAVYSDSVENEYIACLIDLEISLQPFLTPGTLISSKADEYPLKYGSDKIISNEMISLVVMGSKERKIGSAFLGSNTTKMINDLNAPLLIIPSDAVYSPIERAIFACELKNVQKIPVQIIRSFVEPLKCKLYLVNVAPYDENVDPDVILQIEKLHDLLNGINAEYQYTHEQEIEEGIYQFAEEHQAELIIVVHKEHGFFHTLLHDSTTKKMVMHSSIPLLVLKETEG